MCSVSFSRPFFVVLIRLSAPLSPSQRSRQITCKTCSSRFHGPNRGRTRNRSHDRRDHKCKSHFVLFSSPRSADIAYRLDRVSTIAIALSSKSVQTPITPSLLHSATSTRLQIMCSEVLLLSCRASALAFGRNSACTLRVRLPRSAPPRQRLIRSARAEIIALFLSYRASRSCDQKSGSSHRLWIVIAQGPRGTVCRR
jgi:hypothetical protein